MDHEKNDCAEGTPADEAVAARPGDDLTPEEREAARRARLPEPAQRALAEADARRAAQEKDAALPVELGGRDGPEPVRFGDWEKKGIAIDF